MENEEEIINRAKKNPETFGRLFDFYYRPMIPVNRVMNTVSFHPTGLAISQ